MWHAHHSPTVLGLGLPSCPLCVEGVHKTVVWPLIDFFETKHPSFGTIHPYLPFLDCEFFAQMNAPSPEGRHGKTERTDSDDKPILATVQSACLAGKQMNAPSPEQGYGRRGRTVSDDEPIPTPRPSDERLTFQAPGRTERTLVNQFGSSPSLYSTGDDCVRLHVRPGCLGAGQIAGPVTIEMKELCVLVECDGCSFLVSAVADCQPSGATFDVPLNLDFRVGQELDEGDKGAEDRPGLDHYLESLRDTFQVVLGLLPLHLPLDRVVMARVVVAPLLPKTLKLSMSAVLKGNHAIDWTPAHSAALFALGPRYCTKRKTTTHGSTSERIAQKSCTNAGCFSFVRG